MGGVAAQNLDFNLFLGGRGWRGFNPVDEFGGHSGKGAVILLALVADCQRVVTVHDNLAGGLAFLVYCRHLAATAIQTYHDHADAVRASFENALDHSFFRFVGDLLFGRLFLLAHW